MKQSLLYYSKCFRKNQKNQEALHAFYRSRKLYKKTIRDSKRNFEYQILENLNSLKSNNPRAFWETFSKLKSLDTKHKTNPISPQEWVTHFTKLLNQPQSIGCSNELEIDKYITENKDKIFNELNFRIKDSEINKAISKLKNNKSSGIDCIEINEMLKAGAPTLTPFLCKLFNQILTSGIFPDGWRVNTLTPLHKKGSIHNTANYRGIAVGSNLAKLFCSVLHLRLSAFIECNTLIPTNQIGYKKKSRTVDHILTLKNIIDKYILKAPRKYLFTCFMDFKSAFDTVWRKA